MYRLFVIYSSLSNLFGMAHLCPMVRFKFTIFETHSMSLCNISIYDVIFFSFSSCACIYVYRNVQLM